ncbi:MAG: UDP-3-O-(3-hydroxymyristoyl)glucosamine N-acyltransferase [Chromatiales bacterium]
MSSFRLADLAARTDAELRGDGGCEIERVDTLQDATAGAIAFLANPAYRRHLETTGASAVILRPEWQADCPVPALVTDNPYLVYARVAALLHPEPAQPGGVHPTAVVAGSARLAADAWIGPGAVVEEEARVGARAFVGPGCVVGRGVEIGEDCRLVARVTLGPRTRLGRRVLIHPGAVIGGDGFGLANDGGAWVKVPQLGGVALGDDVEIGANTTVDRGAIQDTVIEAGVKLDNLIQVAHNVRIGAHTAIAACAGISGSTQIGRHCTIGGAAGLAGHLQIADGVHITGMAMVTRSIREPGVYSGNLPAESNRQWRRNVAHFRRLEDLSRRVKALEAELAGKGAGETRRAEPED